MLLALKAILVLVELFHLIPSSSSMALHKRAEFHPISEAACGYDAPLIPVRAVTDQGEIVEIPLVKPVAREVLANQEEARWEAEDMDSGKRWYPVEEWKKVEFRLPLV
ncbi:hypothetical protein PtA15_3A487 [Puccinia triticina]|uniref:Uncharacterized protein n=1 Tax=Puccinia triticina TaxID=208348 RepID=A0ABY7CH12_9BASI|nr:uncharacterized protein PtA15_3A487 [Puccinia triticina]WAQ83120.1 hypothetical protein PtA15_3A487 [Puccinia triticina]WAR53962.1 hypothetical protein PtB15_3B471 [Puccinia triticina]